MDAVLGLDTSCYTTSVALAWDGAVIGQKRRLLTVEAGERGLQQSQAVFQHVTRLPGLIEELLGEHPDVKICAVCASTRPRDADGSYMPVFTVGEGHGRALAAALRVPFYATSHQQGHVRAALVDSGLTSQEFLALHLSGGTTELLHIQNGRLTLLGGSSDLHAGQLVDRVGVALGLGFPCGPALEDLARRGQARSILPVRVRGMECSFSGSESAAQRLIVSGGLSPEDMAAEVYSCIARTLAKLFENARQATRQKRVLLSGGVASSLLLRELLPERLHRLKSPMKLYWGRPEYSGDNACGVALLGADETEETIERRLSRLCLDATASAGQTHPSAIN